MKKRRKVIKRIVPVLTTVCVIAALSFSACGGSGAPADRNALSEVSITVFNGEHYKVIGANKKSVARGDSAVYEIAVDAGYELVSSFGKECEIIPFKENHSFNQIVTFPSVNYNTTVTLAVRALELTEFNVTSNIDECEVEIESAAGQPSEGQLYEDDIISLYAIPATGYRFHCWSTGNYLSAGGRYLSNEKILNEFDFNSTSELYANFKSTADSARTIIYDFGSGVEIEQDCSPIVAHHYRANTLTEPDLTEYGFDFPENKMLAGWLTENGEYVGLGSRTEVSEETYITLTPIWKEHSPASDFVFDNGKITDYIGNSKEIVVPNKIYGEEVTAIAEKTFENCTADTFYLPSTVTTVESNAFLNCVSLKEFYMSDNIMNISDDSFTGCANFTTLHLNAYLKPRYMTDSASLKGDIIDRIILDKQIKKCVIFGGSSVFYGYNTYLSKDILQRQYNVYNLGWNMSMCGYAYYDIIEDYLIEGDIFLHAPEQGALSWSGQILTSVLTNENSFRIAYPYLFYICENNWQFLSELKINKYSNLFNQFSRINQLRKDIKSYEYYDYCNTISDGQEGGFTITGEAIYNECENAGHVFLGLGNLSFDTPQTLVTLADTIIYRPMVAKGVKVCVVSAPINRHNLYLTYNDEENLKIAAEKYTQMVKATVAKEVTVLLSQYDTIYDGEHFSDSDYHLGHPIRDEHTAKVMNALVDALGL